MPPRREPVEPWIPRLDGFEKFKDAEIESVSVHLVVYYT